MAFVLLAQSLFPHWSRRGDVQHSGGIWPGWCPDPRDPEEVSQALSRDLLGQSPLHLVEGKAHVLPPAVSKTASSLLP